VSKEIKNDVVNSLIEIECENLLLKSDNSFLEKYVYQDDLTCVFNYRKLCYDIVSSIQSSKLTGKRFCLVFIDIDNFKKINDQYGHFVGSSLLQQLSQLFTKILKKNFQIYRYGGDEFVFLCMNTTNEELIKELEFLKDEVSSIKFQLEKNKTYQMSLSAGYAEYPTHGKTLKEMIEIADKMMYESKKFKSQKVINLKKNG
jgi:diguanylate cyclase (GGDEF)-like protein